MYIHYPTISHFRLCPCPFSYLFFVISFHFERLTN